MGARDGLEILKKIKIPWPCLEPQVVQSTDYTVLAPVVITVANIIVSLPIVSGLFRKGAVTY
jgi:hypothetical protein